MNKKPKEIKICVGSCCFHNGTSEIVDYVKDQKNSNLFPNSCEISGVFCLGKCGKGMSISIDDEVRKIQSLAEFEQILRDIDNEYNNHE